MPLTTTCNLKSAFRIVLIVGLAAISGSHGKQSAADPFPMKEGASWVYHGTVRWYDMQAQKTVTTNVTSRSEVIRVIRRNGLEAIIIKGFPADFNWSEGNAPANRWLFVRTEDDQLHWFTDNHEIEERLERLDNPRDFLQGMWTDDDLLLQLPPRKGMKFCDVESKARTDDLYCWVVVSEREVSLNDVKGLKPGKRTAFLLQYVTLPDDTELEFVPGVGFISYQYHHHGTVAETEMTLIEYHAPGSPPASPGAKQ